jgi:hypothetical protein
VLPTDLLLRLMNATPEQYAAVREVLGLEECQPDGPPPTDNELRNAFALVVKLDAQGKQELPTPMTVFRFYCAKSLSIRDTAMKCKCGRTTVCRRLRQIEQATRMKPIQFRVISGSLLEMIEDYERSGVREIYRQSLVSDD